MTQGAVEPAGVGRDDVFRLLGALGGILTLATAFMFYFGWRRSEAQSKAMGLDVSLFGFSSQDYVLRSISSLYLPLLAVSGLGLAWVAVHVRITGRLRGVAAYEPGDRDRLSGRVRLVFWLAVAVAFASVIFTVGAGFSEPPAPIASLARRLADRRWIVPMVLVLATLTAAYAGWARRLMEGPAARSRPSPWASALATTLTGAIVVLGSFWMLEEYAATVGRGYAAQLVLSVASLPRATVISGEPLGLEAPGVEQAVLVAADPAATRYRTTGLRLLARTPSKVILVHDGWAPGSGEVIVLPDSEALTWEFSK